MRGTSAKIYIYPLLPLWEQPFQDKGPTIKGLLLLIVEFR